MLKNFTDQMLPAVEAAMQRAVERARLPGCDELHFMLAYHLGWEGEGAGLRAQGKRIRPLLALLSAAGCGVDWRLALPAAVAVELLHNFSLIHDDIEDNSPLRRGRATLWTRWGIPQAINTGDTLFTLAYLALSDLQLACSPQVALSAQVLFQEACLHLTQGQHMDIGYETRRDLTEADYWPMIEGKTAALLSACTGLGALVGGVDGAVLTAYRRFGRFLGLAFQAQDDLLGIWGDAALTGKSAESDLVDGKKSLPVLYGMGRGGAFAQRWAQGPVSAAEVPALAAQLEVEGAREYTRSQADRLTTEALQALNEADPQGEAGDALCELAEKLLKRQA